MNNVLEFIKILVSLSSEDCYFEDIYNALSYLLNDPTLTETEKEQLKVFIEAYKIATDFKEIEDDEDEYDDEEDFDDEFTGDIKPETEDYNKKANNADDSVLGILKKMLQRKDEFY